MERGRHSCPASEWRGSHYRKWPSLSCLYTQGSLQHSWERLAEPQAEQWAWAGVTVFLGIVVPLRKRGTWRSSSQGCFYVLVLWQLTGTSKPTWGLPSLQTAYRGPTEQAGPILGGWKQGPGVPYDWPVQQWLKTQPQLRMEAATIHFLILLTAVVISEKYQAIPSSVSWRDEGLLGSQQPSNSLVSPPVGQSTIPSHQGMKHVHLLPVQLVELFGQTVKWGLIIVHLLL